MCSLGLLLLRHGQGLLITSLILLELQQVPQVLGLLLCLLMAVLELVDGITDAI